MDHRVYDSPSRLIKKRFSIQSFQKYILNSQDNMKTLTKMIKQCNVDDLNCRFNVWRLTLGVISSDSSIDQKKYYFDKKEETIRNFNKKSSPVKQHKKNPLMMMGGGKNQTKQTESDSFLKQEIQKDVQRTYQQMPFFLNKDIQKLLNLILFIWCRRNNEVSYKQGMNQLLASVVVCYFQEVELRTIEDKPQDISQDLWKTHIFFNSVEHAQADIFSIFEKIVDIQGDMYKTEADQCIKQKVNPNSKNNTPILQRIMQIKDHKLKQMDMELFRIIKLQDVQTKSFMLRWIRCMHTRQFSLQNSFVIWDSIFLEYMESPQSKKKGQFQFIDAMCLSMFIYMRSIVFKKQTAGEILQVYQKYPVLKRGDYLDELIALAWTVCEELRLESNNANQVTNQFQVSDKIKNIKFMNNLTQEQKAQTQKKNVNTHKIHNQTTNVEMKKPETKQKIKLKSTQKPIIKQKPIQKPIIKQQKTQKNEKQKKIPEVSSILIKQQTSNKKFLNESEAKEPQKILIQKGQLRIMLGSLRSAMRLMGQFTGEESLQDVGSHVQKVVEQLEAMNLQ